MSTNSRRFENVAARCNEFESVYDTDSFTNMYNDNASSSCKNCKHFSSNEYCSLNLYDSIVDDDYL